jgi:hypothetical protein
VTLRDASADRTRLDFVRKSRDSDRLTRPIDLRRKWTFIGDVRLEAGALVWQLAEPRRLGEHWIFDGEVERQAILTRRQAEHAGRGVLDDFLALRDGDDDAILKYCRTWGVLELCRHNLPACHEFSLDVPLRLPDPLQTKPVRQAQRVFDPDPRQCIPLGIEPLATWRFFSAQARALLNVAANLEKRELGEKNDWAVLLRAGVNPAPSLNAQRRCVRDALEGWLKLGRIKPTIDDLSGGLTWTGADLFGELAVQIALTVEKIEGRVLCIACGKPYAPKRRVIRRGFNYCPAPACQRQADAQRAKRYRERKLSRSPRGVRDLPYRGLYQGRTNDPLFSE